MYFENCDKESKKAVLKYMLERKQILFGKFDDTLTKEKKSAGWQDVHKFALSLGYHKKEWQYIRDTFWPNIRQTTMVLYGYEPSYAPGQSAHARSTHGRRSQPTPKTRQDGRHGERVVIDLYLH
jgi:hypothetical protein